MRESRVINNKHPNHNLESFRSILPVPFADEDFHLLEKTRISGAGTTDVYINNAGDFAFLFPQPRVDYLKYESRVKKLNLQEYKIKLSVLERRFEKIRHIFGGSISNVLEIGAAEGGFLRIVHDTFPGLILYALEKDRQTKSDREEIVGVNDYDDISDLISKELRFDSICIFHVLEHVLKPAYFFDDIKKICHSDTIIIIEVPSLLDPLLSLYSNEAYKKFYFQAQHPFIYTPASLSRLMECSGFRTTQLINHQRYSLENHLNWLVRQRPGGSDLFRSIFKGSEPGYLHDLEKNGKTDTVIWVGRVANGNKGIVL